MTKEELLEFVKTQFEQSGEEFGVSTAFDIFFTALELYIRHNLNGIEVRKLDQWMKDMWSFYLMNHEV